MDEAWCLLELLLVIYLSLRRLVVFLDILSLILVHSMLDVIMLHFSVTCVALLIINFMSISCMQSLT